MVLSSYSPPTSDLAIQVQSLATVLTRNFALLSVPGPDLEIRGGGSHPHPYIRGGGGGGGGGGLRCSLFYPASYRGFPKAQ